MKAQATILVLLTGLASGCTFGKHSLPDGFEVRAVGNYRWAPFPYAEGDVYYDFIGIGWLMHDERADELQLHYQGEELATAAHQGRGGWKLTAVGREKIAKSGWSLGGYKSGMLVGAARQSSPSPEVPPTVRKRFTPGAPYLNSDDETKYLYRWTATLEPLRTLDDSADTIVFLVYSWDQAYLRIASFDSSRYDWIDSLISPGGDARPGGYVVSFTLRERKTGRMLRGRYPYQLREAGQVALEPIQDTAPE